MKILNEHTTQTRINKYFELLLDDKQIIKINKWAHDDDCDWDFDDDESKQTYEKLSDDEQLKVDDFINDLKL